MLLDQLPQLDDEFGRIAECEVEFEELFRRGQPALLDGCRRRLDDRAAAPRQNGSSPERQGSAQYLRGFGCAAVGSRELRFAYQ